MTMGHAFSLAAVLSIREQREGVEERKLLAIAGEIAQLNAVRERVDHEITQLQIKRAQGLETPRIAAEYQASFARWKMLSEMRTQIQVQLEELERRRLTQQRQYMEAKAGCEMLQKLRAQQRAAWDVQMKGRDQKRIDDFFGARHSRK